jgi:hypothetical protein
MGGWFASESLAGMDRNYRLLCSGFRIMAALWARLAQQSPEARGCGNTIVT